MIELEKETLLHYFPYRQTPNGLVENESIYHVILQIEGLLWETMNVDGELALRLFDYQADISQRKKHFEKMKEELSDDMQARQEAFHKDRKKIVNEHFPQEVQQSNPNLPYSLADNPGEAKQAFEDLKEEYADLLDRIEEIQEDFDKKMKGISKVKLNNTDLFTREDTEELSGKLVRAIRPLIQDYEAVEAQK